jgi:hypothetical protein
MADPSPILLRLFAAAALTCLASACEESLGVPEANRLPIARATVLGADGGSSASFDYAGSPVTITLDGSGSSDPDGKIARYRWLSGNLRPDADAASGGVSGGGGSSGGGSGGGGVSGGGSADDADGGSDLELSATLRWVPDGEQPDWPADVAQPVVELGEGTFTFVLWVVDDGGAVSEPVTLQITVAAPLSPAVAACVSGAVATVERECKVCVCGVSDDCRAAAAQTVCGPECWGLLSCIATRCPTYMTGGDTSCLVSMCSAFLPGATGAQRIAPCLTPCRDSCN